MAGAMRVAVLVSGRGSNLQAVLDAAHAGRLGAAAIVAVISDVPTAPALERARAAGVEAVAIDRKSFASREAFDGAVVESLRARTIDLVVLAGYMRLVGDAFLRAFPERVINIHPSLLPAFPGLHGVAQALEYGVKIAGCTDHFVDQGTDTGSIILQAAVPVLDGDDEASLAERILGEEHRLLPEAIRLIVAGLVEKVGRRVSIRRR